VPLIGFSGSPWTLACYMVEGQGSRDFARLKAMCWNEPALAHQLLDTLAQSVAAYLIAQAAAGAQALMVFDTWGGLLGPAAFHEFSLRYMTQVVEALKANPHSRELPVILFSKGAGQHLARMADTGCAGLGVDWTIDLADARQAVAGRVALQGNGRAAFQPARDPPRGAPRVGQLWQPPWPCVQPGPRHHAGSRPRACEGAGR
jgi:uroporphyrinogen decarboxylase